MSKILKTITFLLLFMIAAVAIMIAWFWYQYYHQSLIVGTKPQIILVKPNSSIQDFIRTLKQRDLLRHPKFFASMMLRQANGKSLRYGEYWIKPDTSAAQLLDNVLQGQGLVRHHITFIEGWTFQQIKTELAKNKILEHKIAGKTDQEIMEMLGHLNQKPEGRFFPSTYYFLWGYSDLDILQKSYKKMQRFLKKQWRLRAKGIPYRKPYQALIVASMIEKETALKKERPLIAGVILRRLRNGMRLQIDPTVLYGLGKPYGTQLTKHDLHVRTPYNTYRKTGLPPTPIAMPSASSIIASLHPKDSMYLYYVSRGDGSHQFSVTFKEHLVAIKQYYGTERSQEAMQERLPVFLLDKVKLLKTLEFVFHVYEI